MAHPIPKKRVTVAGWGPKNTKGPPIGLNLDGQKVGEGGGVGDIYEAPPK